MPVHMQRDLDALKKAILAVGALVEEAANKAIQAVNARRPELAEQVINGDGIIDEREVQVEEDCLKILALHQPVAADLRFIVTVLKVNNDLERMGDLAVNIAERALHLCELSPLDVDIGLSDMCRRVQTMVRQCLDALVQRDTSLAREICAADDAVDHLYERAFTTIHERMISDPSSIDRAIHLLSISRHLERIADQATNVAEDVIFLVDGEVVRHRMADLAP